MRKTKTEHLRFGTHRSGMEEHAKFIEELNSKNGRIVHAWTEFHEYSSSHKPAILNYIVEYNKRLLTMKKLDTDTKAMLFVLSLVIAAFALMAIALLINWTEV